MSLHDDDIRNLFRLICYQIVCRKRITEPICSFFHTAPREEGNTAAHQLGCLFFLTFRLRRIRQCSFGLLNNLGRSTTSQTTMETLSEESKLITTHKKDERSLLKRIFKVKTRQKATGLVKITLNFAYNIAGGALFKATAKVKQHRVETTAMVKHQKELPEFTDNL